MTSYGSDLFTKNVHSSGTIHWKNFDPPLSSAGGDIPTLAAVLEASDPEGDADGHVITNLGGLSMKGDANIANSDGKITGAAEVQCNQMTATFATSLEVQVGDNLALGTAGASGGTITFNSQASQGACSLTGPSATNQCVFTNCNFDSVTNTFPTSIDDDTLGDVMTRGNTASTTLDMDSNNITNSAAISCNSLSATGTSGFEGQIGATRQITAPIIQISPAYAGQPVASGIEFNSGITDTTEIRGVSVANRTKLLNCDLSSSTNLQAAPTEERYEWGSVWTNAKTIFPPPPYADGTTTQIPTIDLVRFDFNTIDLTRTPQWRYFAPQSDSDRQIDPDDHMELHEGEYIGNRGGPNSTAWAFAFYATTAATTIASHASQVVEFHFPSTFYGYGRIYMCLAAHGPPYTSEPVIYQQTFRLVMEHEGSAISTNPRINGPVQMKWYCKDMFPTDGTQWRVYPMCRVDDARHYGRLQINIGNGQPLDGNNPGDPPDFTPSNTNAQNGQLLLRGYPLPGEWNEMENVAPS